MKQQRGILVVGDDRINTMATVKILETSGQFHRIRTIPGSSKGLEALTTASGDDVMDGDLILIDLDMREMDGFAFIRSLFRLRPPVQELRRRIIVTGKATPHNTCHAKLLHLGMFLEKPLILNAIQIVVACASGKCGEIIPGEWPGSWLGRAS